MASGRALLAWCTAWSRRCSQGRGRRASNLLFLIVLLAVVAIASAVVPDALDVALFASVAAAVLLSLAR